MLGGAWARLLAVELILFAELIIWVVEDTSDGESLINKLWVDTGIWAGDPGFKAQQGAQHGA